MSKIRLSETEHWHFKIGKGELLAALNELTGSNSWQHAKRKDKINLYIGDLTDTGFSIRENPNIGRLTPVSGTINHTRFTGKIKTNADGIDVEVEGSREDLHVIGPTLGPIVLGLILIFNLSAYPLYQLAIGTLAVIIDLLIIRGINGEVREGMAKLKKKLIEIEKTQDNKS